MQGADQHAPALLAPRGAAAMLPARLVVNANASGAARRLDEVAAYLVAEGADLEVSRTHSPEEFAELWQCDDGRRLILLGGDGTVHAAANAPGPAREVAVIPAGSANNVARSTGIPRDLSQAARLAVHGKVRPIDLIEARSGAMRRLIVESVSVGFLAQARVRYHGSNSAHQLAGLRAGAAALERFKPLAVHIKVPGFDERLRLAQLFVANLPFYEFGLHVAPQADPTDRTLDLIGIEATSRLGVLRMISELRTHLPEHGVHVWRAPAVLVATGGASPVVGDSEDLGCGPIALTAVAAALRLVRP